MNFKKFQEEKFNSLSELAIEANSERIEEDFKSSDLIKVGTLISKIATKRIGGVFTYLYTEDFKKSNGESGVGALFVSDKGSMLRFNFLMKSKKGYSVNSIDYWKGRKIGDNPNN